jgi:hypothetical protein
VVYNYLCTCCLNGAGRNDFDAGKILYKGHWEGCALKIETFLGPEMETKFEKKKLGTSTVLQIEILKNERFNDLLLF